jgi:hypothetical protein
MTSLRAGWLSGLCVFALTLPLAGVCLLRVLGDHGLAAGAAESPWTGDPGARLAALALSQYDEARTDAQFALAVRTARRALRYGPMENDALLVLAFDADRTGRRAETARLMSILGRRTQRDTQVQLWLAEDALAKGDSRAAFLHLDMALRRDLSLGPVVFPLMAASLDQPDASQEMAARLSHRPNWRKGFLAALAEDDGAEERADQLLRALRATSAPPLDDEVAAVLQPILERGQYAKAREIWSALSPARGRKPALLYDGGFSGQPGAAPFNWRLTGRDGAYSELAKTPEGLDALQVRYPISRGQTLAEQLLVLPPGSYRLAGLAQTIEGEAEPRLQWRLSCADAGNTPFAVAAIDPAEDGWSTFSLAFQVPAQGCSAQWLRLANTPQAAFTSAEVSIRAVTLSALEQSESSVQ